jgi:hypothetical protein
MNTAVIFHFADLCEYDGQVCLATDLYFGRTQFESCPDYKLSWVFRGYSTCEHKGHKGEKDRRKWKKVRAVPLHAMEALGGRGCIPPTHLRPRHYMGVSGQRHAPAALLPPGKGPPVPTGQETGWAPEPVWTQRLEEKSFAPAGDRTPIARSSSRSQTLYWLS